MGYKILYVEDDDIARMLLFRQLAEKYDEIFQAENGARGLELYKEHSPDVVVTDLTMPVMSGVEMIKHIQHIRADQPIVVLTGFHEQAKFLEGCMVLKKPVSAADVLKLISEIRSS